MAPFLTRNSNCPSWEFSGPSPTLGNQTTEQARGLSEITKAEQLSGMLHLLGNPETSKEWQEASEASPGAVMHCLMQTAVLQCQSRKTKGRPHFQKKTSIRKHKTAITEGPKRGQTCSGRECLSAELRRAPAILSHSGTLMRAEGGARRFYDRFIHVLKILGNSFTVDLNQKMRKLCIF